jgi:hypothetical protein
MTKVPHRAHMTAETMQGRCGDDRRTRTVGTDSTEGTDAVNSIALDTTEAPVHITVTGATEQHR